nr:petrograndin=N-glycosidase type-1 ribosome-inactivating protein {N-terminal} [Petrocoptis grandiflora, Rothm, Peptide Partial, 20 aa] [Petrocoptis grandiflora]
IALDLAKPTQAKYSTFLTSI